MYDKREWNQHQRVRGGRVCRTSYALSPSGLHSNEAAIGHGNTALQGQQTSR